jgi:hypothetical protein
MMIRAMQGAHEKTDTSLGNPEPAIAEQPLQLLPFGHLWLISSVCGLMADRTRTSTQSPGPGIRYRRKNCRNKRRGRLMRNLTARVERLERG